VAVRALSVHPVRRAQQEPGGELVLFNTGPDTHEEFAVVRLDRMLDVRR
jgi:hypothetical protein